MHRVLKFSLRLFKSWFYSDVYDFLGFNTHLCERTSFLQKKTLHIVDVTLTDELIRKKGITTLAELQGFVKDQLSDKRSKKKKTIQVNFKITIHTNFFRLIHQDIPDYQDQLNLRTAYFEARRRQPWASKFVDTKVKILVHIRQGDTAVIKTPWNTYIPVKNFTKNRFAEHRKFSDIQSDIFLQVSDYYDFVSMFITHFNDDMFSILFFSDGFRRAFDLLHKDIERLKLTPDRLKILNHSQKHYDQKAFEILKGIKNGETVIGESSTNLFDLIHSALSSDIVIIGTQQQMIPKLLTNYCANYDQLPTVIVLHRGSKPNHSRIGLNDALKKKLIYFNIHEPDYEWLNIRLTKQCSILA